MSPTLVRYGLGGPVTLKTHYVFICYGFCVCVCGGGSFNLNHWHLEHIKLKAFPQLNPSLFAAFVPLFIPLQ